MPCLSGVHYSCLQCHQSDDNNRTCIRSIIERLHNNQPTKCQEDRRKEGMHAWILPSPGRSQHPSRQMKYCTLERMSLYIAPRPKPGSGGRTRPTWFAIVCLQYEDLMCAEKCLQQVNSALAIQRCGFALLAFLVVCLLWCCPHAETTECLVSVCHALGALDILQ